MRRLVALIILLLLLLPTVSLADLNAYFLDVGQGDATLITCDGNSLLIDTGPNVSTAALLRQLRALDVEQVDFLIGTHPHEDHIGGLSGVLKTFNVREIMMPKAEHNTQTFVDALDAIEANGLQIITPLVGDTYKMGGASITVLSPARNDYSELNFHSVVLRIEYDNFSILMTGDAEDVNEFEMIDAGLLLNADILKVGHHGSDTSTSPAFLDAVAPSVAVISCGDGNLYGHPNEIVLNRLLDTGCSVYRTDVSGMITITSDGQDYEVWGTRDVPQPAAQIETAWETYVLNTNTMKFHQPNCASSKRIMDKNRDEHTGTRDDVIGMGYDPCKNCNP